MHSLLAEKYVERAREYERADSDHHPLPGSAETMTFALVEIARQRDELKEKLSRLGKPVEVTTS